MLAIQIRQRRKRKIGQGVFTRGNGVGFEIDQVHNAQMDFAHRIGVVVKQADDALTLTTWKFKLFIKFARNGGVVDLRPRTTAVGIDGVDVTADTDGNFRMQSAFAAGFSASVMQDAFTVTKDTIGNELLERRIILGLGAIHEKMIRRIEQLLHRRVHAVGAKSFKNPELLEQLAFHHQDQLACVF